MIRQEICSQRNSSGPDSGVESLSTHQETEQVCLEPSKSDSEPILKQISLPFSELANPIYI